MTQLSLLTASSDHQPLPGAWDEMWDSDAGVRPHWAHLVNGLANRAADNLLWAGRYLERAERVARQVGGDAHILDVAVTVTRLDAET